VVADYSHILRIFLSHLSQELRGVNIKKFLGFTNRVAQSAELSEHPAVSFAEHVLHLNYID
jgi:hypothetical protein